MGCRYYAKPELQLVARLLPTQEAALFGLYGGVIRILMLLNLVLLLSAHQN